MGRAIDLGGDVTRRAAIAGALVGAADGPAVVPARWATYVHGPVGGNTYRLRQVRRLAERLLGWDLPEAPEPRRRVGPVEVLPKLWLSNLPAATRFTAAHPEGAVISLCPTRGTLDGHPVRREFALADTSGPDDNPQLAAVLDEILAAVDAFHDEGRPVLVHCHHGASRTGLVLRAWLMRAHDIGEDDATTEAIALWSKTSTHNRAFTRELRARE